MRESVLFERYTFKALYDHYRAEIMLLIAAANGVVYVQFYTTAAHTLVHIAISRKSRLYNLRKGKMRKTHAVYMQQQYG